MDALRVATGPLGVRNTAIAKVKAIGARISIKTKGFNVLHKLEALFALSIVIGGYVEGSIVVIGRRYFIT